MRSWPANARTSISSVLRGRWKLVSSRSTTRKGKPGVMKRSVSPCPAAAPRRPAANAADSSARRVVVPTATIAAAARARARDRRRGGGADLEALAVHDVLGEALAAHRLERAGADVQRDRRALDAARAQRREQLGVEVQRRGRRRDRAGPLGEHGLVALDVVAFVGALDVGRQRHVAVALEQAPAARRESAGGTANRRCPRGRAPRRRRRRRSGRRCRPSATCSRAPARARRRRPRRARPAPRPRRRWP